MWHILLLSHTLLNVRYNLRDDALYLLCPRCTRFIQGYIWGGGFPAEFALDDGLFPWFDEVEEVEEAGEEELWDAAAVEVFCAAEEAGDEADPAADVLAELAGAGLTGELLLAGAVLRSWGELTPVAAVVESAYLHEWPLRLVTPVAEVLLRIGDTAPGVCSGWRWPTPRRWCVECSWV